MADFDLDAIDKKIAAGNDVSSDELNAYCEALLSGDMVLNNETQEQKEFLDKLAAQLSKQMDARQGLDSAALRDNTNEDIVKVSQFQRWARVFGGNRQRQQRKLSEAEAVLLSAVANKEALTVAASFDIHKENATSIDVDATRRTLREELVSKRGLANAFERRRIKKRLAELIPNTRLDKEIAEVKEAQATLTQKHQQKLTTLQSKHQKLQAQTQDGKRQAIQLQLDAIQRQMSGELTSAEPTSLDDLQKQEASLKEQLAQTPTLKDLQARSEEANKKFDSISDYINGYLNSQNIIADAKDAQTHYNIVSGMTPEQMQLTPEQAEAQKKSYEARIRKGKDAEQSSQLLQAKVLEEFGIDISKMSEKELRDYLKKVEKEKDDASKSYKEAAQADRAAQLAESEVRRENSDYQTLSARLADRAQKLDTQKSSDPYGIEKFTKDIEQNGYKNGIFSRGQKKELDNILKEAPTSQLGSLEKALTEKIEKLKAEASQSRSSKRIKELQQQIAGLTSYTQAISSERVSRNKRFKEKSDEIARQQNSHINEAFEQLHSNAGRLERRDAQLLETTTLAKTLELVCSKMDKTKSQELMDRYRKQIKENNIDLSGLSAEQQLSIISALKENGYDLSVIEARLGIKEKDALAKKAAQDHIDTDEPVTDKEDDTRNPHDDVTRKSSVVTHVEHKDGVEITKYESGLEVSRPDENTYNISGEDGKTPTDEQCAEFVAQLKKDNYESFSVAEDVTPEFYASMVKAAEAAGMTIENKEAMDKKFARNDGNRETKDNRSNSETEEKHEPFKLRRNEKGDILLTEAQLMALDSEGRLDIGGLNEKRDSLTLETLSSENRAYLEELGLGEQHIRNMMKKEAKENNELTDAQRDALDAEGRNIMGGEKKTYSELHSQDKAYLEDEGLGQDYNGKVQRNTEIAADMMVTKKDITVEKMDLLVRAQGMKPEEFEEFKKTEEYRNLPAQQRKLVNAVNALENKQEFKSQDDRRRAVILGRLVGQYKASVAKETSKEGKQAAKQRFIDQKITRHLKGDRGNS
ncbi:MAG: hypothetical protein E7010_01375 [Alphaproteobacteria bacterium]|nr:hypothetical protein [Alphaproteobacteria bacterium]